MNITKVVACVVVLGLLSATSPLLAQETIALQDTPDSLPIYLFASEGGEILGITPINEDFVAGCVIQVGDTTGVENLPKTPPIPECFVLAPDSALATSRPEDGAGVEYAFEENTTTRQSSR